MPDYSDCELDKNDNQAHGNDDDRSQAGSADDDVFVQAAAISGEMNRDAITGQYHVVDESGHPVVSKSIHLIFIFS